MKKAVRQVAISAELADPAAKNEVARLIELGAVEIIEGRVTGNLWHAYFNPEIPISPETLRRTGLSTEFLSDKPTFDRMALELYRYLDGAEAAVFGAFPFDTLDFELARCGMGTRGKNVVDLEHRANTLQPGADSSLGAVCRRFYVNTDRLGYPSNAMHRAAIIASLAIKLSSDRIGSAVAQLVQSERVEIQSFEHFIEATNGISRTCLCRGVTDKDFLLLPSLFRTPTNESPDVLEQKLMWVFENQAVGIIDRLPVNEVEWLTVAQHHGLPTRLLDWSLSPLAAAFFAVESLSASAGSVVLLELDRFRRAQRIDLKKLSKIVAFLPSCPLGKASHGAVRRIHNSSKRAAAARPESTQAAVDSGEDQERDEGSAGQARHSRWQHVSRPRRSRTPPAVPARLLTRCGPRNAVSFASLRLSDSLRSVKVRMAMAGFRRVQCRISAATDNQRANPNVGTQSVAVARAARPSA